MSDKKFQDIPADERLQVLIDNCDERRHEKYMKDLSRDELEIRLQRVAENCIKFNDLEEELKEIKSEFKEKMEPLKKDNKEKLTEIKNKKAEFTDHLFDFLEDGWMNTYDKDGDLVGTRRLNADEKAKQAKLFVSHKSGTND